MIERLPIRWLVVAVPLATALAVLVQLLLLALFVLGSAPFDGLRLWFNGMLFAVPVALAFGVPLAAWLLRDRERGYVAWGIAGLVAGLVGGGAILGVFALFTRVDFDLDLPLVLGFTVSGGLLTALLARAIAWALARRFA